MAFTELPFGSPDPDLQHLRATLATRPPILPAGPFRMAFAGAIGPGMLPVIEAFIAALAELKKSGTPVSAHFYGTTYSHLARNETVTHALATKYGVLECVHEHSRRLPYFQALQVTLEAEVNLLFGSTDLAFTPSKILALLAAGRPILALAHEGSAMTVRLDALGLPRTVVGTGPVTTADIQSVVTRLREIRQMPAPIAPDSLSARAVAARQVAIFASACAAQS